MGELRAYQNLQWLVRLHLFVKCQANHHLPTLNFICFTDVSATDFISNLLHLYQTKLLYTAFHHSIIYIYMLYQISMFPLATFCIMATAFSIKRQWIFLKMQHNCSNNTGQQRLCPIRKKSVSDVFLDAEFKYVSRISLSPFALHQTVWKHKPTYVSHWGGL